MVADQGDKTNIGRMKEKLAKDTRHVSDIWNDAIKNYEGIVSLDLRPTFTSVDDMMAAGTAEMDSFPRFRHNKKDRQAEELVRPESGLPSKRSRSTRVGGHSCVSTRSSHWDGVDVDADGRHHLRTEPVSTKGGNRLTGSTSVNQVQSAAASR